MLNHFFNVCLFLTDEIFIISFISVGYLLFNRTAFAKTMMLLLFNTILLNYLSTIWHLPFFATTLGKVGLVFPNGQMQVSMLLWGSIAILHRNWLFRLFALGLLACIGMGLLHFQYATLNTIASSVGIGALFLLIYHGTLHELPMHKHWIISLSLTIIGFCLLPLLPYCIRQEAPWLAEGGLIGFFVGWILQNNYILKRKNPAPILSIILLIVGIGLFYVTPNSFNQLAVPQTTFYLLKAGLLGFWISFLIFKLLDVLRKTPQQR